MPGWRAHVIPWRPKLEELPVPPEEAVFAKMLHEGVPKLLTEPEGPGLIEPEPPRRRKQDKSPFAFLPRWALAVAASGGLLAGGAWLNEKTQSQTRLEQAIADAPGKYTSRLGERLAEVEATTRELRDQQGQLRLVMEKDRLEAKQDRKELELLMRQLSIDVGTLARRNLAAKDAGR